MTTAKLLLYGWTWDPAALTIAIVLIAAGWRLRTPSFLAAVSLFLIAQLSPLEILGSRYLLSAHMLQHFILVMIVAPLLLAGSRRWLRRPNPAACWIIGIAAMAVWHIPAIYEMALWNPLAHALELVTCLAAALLFWTPVFTPRLDDRLHPVASVAYLATACLCCTLLGVGISFAKTILYPVYLHAAADPAVLSLVRNDWCISPHTDQELGGLLMWVPGCLVYLGAMLVRLGGWYAQTETEEHDYTATQLSS